MKTRAVQFLEAHQSGERSTFVADAQWRHENASWLRRSRGVALAIIDYMQDNNLSRNDVAARLDVSPQYVSKILSGKVNFSFKSIAEIEDRLGIDCFRAAMVGA
ncbi:MAG: helix-turn-helix transcriptional regulator [Bacteroidaceae bacterium]|nr:helix-turn-helix transcriptional regulator [Bacteroidaceae bacterium]